MVTSGSSYDPSPSDSDWHNDFGLEQQAAVVDRWFGTYGFGWTDLEDLKKKLGSLERSLLPLH